MPQISRRFEWDAAHRVLHHESKCRHLHGHRYVAEVVVSSPVLDELGRVIDFSVLKTDVGKWIDDNWDHNVLLNTKDPLYELYKMVGEDDEVFAGKKPYAFFERNPTAENIATALYAAASDMMSVRDIRVERVRVWETPNCVAIHPGEK